MAIGRSPFAHPCVRRAQYVGLLVIALVWLFGFLIIEGWIPVPNGYEGTVTWDGLWLASVILLMVISALTIVIPLWFAAKQKRVDEERPFRAKKNQVR